MGEQTGVHGPLVTAIITVFNGAPYLRESIESVLGQTYEPIDLILVDDGSTDGSGEIARSFEPRLRVLHRAQRGGIGAARNDAVVVMNGEFVVFVDADDRLLPAAVERAVATFTDRPDLDIAHFHVREFVSPDVAPEERARLRQPVERIVGRLPSTSVMRAEVMRRVGPFAEHLRRGVGVDWSLRAIDVGIRSVVLPDVLLERRLHAQNQGFRERDAISEYAHVLKASLDRRRAAASERPA